MHQREPPSQTGISLLLSFPPSSQSQQQIRPSCRGRLSLCLTTALVSRTCLHAAPKPCQVHDAASCFSRRSPRSNIPVALASDVWCCDCESRLLGQRALHRQTALSPAGLTANSRRLSGQRPRRRRLRLQQQQHGPAETPAPADALARQPVPRLPARGPPLWRRPTLGNPHGAWPRPWHSRRPITDPAYGE